MSQGFYITLNSGKDYRTIAKIMSDKNYQMNHATSRNILISAMKNLFKETAKQLNIELTDKAIEEMVKSQQIHDAMHDILYNAWHGLEKK